MQVSVESTTAIERRMTVGIPSDQVDAAVEKRLLQTARSVRINGFRPGKVPMNVVKKRYGEGVRQEVVGEMMRDAYLEAIQKEKLQPAGYPRFEPKAIEPDKNIEFVAVFEVYPQFAVTGIDAMKIVRQQTEVLESDIDAMIENLRQQSAKWVESDQAAETGDRLVIAYSGTIDNEAFEGGSSDKATVQIGANKMIPGFEDGLTGLRAGDTKTLELVFPETYHVENLRGKAARFAVTVASVSKSELPEVNTEFFTLYGVENADLDMFRAELRKNMAREADNAVKGKVKQQIVERLIEAISIEVPSALVSSEVDRMRQEAVQRFGGGSKMDPSSLPAELFKDQAVKRVQTGLIFAQIVKDKAIRVSEEQVRAKIENLASSYQDPSQFVEWFMSNPEQKSQIETAVLEDLVVEHVMQTAQVEDQVVSYQDAVKPLEKS
jgi:trigger factor